MSKLSVTRKQHFGPAFSITVSIILFTSTINKLVDSRCPPVTKGFIYTDRAHRTMLLSENTMLLQHQMNSLHNVSSSWRCGMLCLVRENCMSYNYARTTGDCQLNDADADVYPCHMAGSHEFGYYQICVDDNWGQVPLQVAAECQTSGSPDTTTSTRASTTTEGPITTKMTTSSGATTEEIDYGTYNCSLPISGCRTFWTEEAVHATMKLEGADDDYNWTLSHIVNGDRFINNNQPCPNILEDESQTELYVRYRMILHYHPNNASGGNYGFCMSYFNNTGLLDKMCSGITPITYIPPMVFLLQDDLIRWSILPTPPQRSFILELNFDASGHHRYFAFGFDGINEGRVWHMCRTL